MLPEGDDMGIPSEDDEELEEEIQSETGFGCVVGKLLAKLNSMYGFCETRCIRKVRTDASLVASQCWTTCHRSLRRNTRSCPVSSGRLSAKLA